LRFKDDVSAASFSPDGRFLIFGSQDASLWTLESARFCPTQTMVLDKSLKDATSAKFHKNSVISMCFEEEVRVIDLKTGKDNHRFTRENKAAPGTRRYSEFSNGGRFFVEHHIENYESEFMISKTSTGKLMYQQKLSGWLSEMKFSSNCKHIVMEAGGEGKLV